MPRKTDRFLKCVYLIGFKDHHKVYIGSSMRWPYRKREHLTHLGLGKHCNSYLQRAYDKHGEANIFISELEFFETNEAMLKAEQKWINHYRSADSDYGYNLVPIIGPGTIGRKATPAQRSKLSDMMKKRYRDNPDLGPRLGKRMKEWRAEQDDPYASQRSQSKSYALFDPNGTLVQIENLAQYCHDNDLELDKMYEVANDIRIEYRGWKKALDRRHRRKNPYDLIGPDGTRHQGFSIRAFALEHDLDYRSMTALVRGRLKTCQGYRRTDMDPKRARTHRGKDHILIDPNGNEVHVNNLTAFCKEHGLKKDNLRAGYRSEGWIKKGVKRGPHTKRTKT